MSNDNQDNQQSEINAETKQAMDDLRAKGFDFEGDQSKEPEPKPEETKAPEPEPKEKTPEAEKEPESKEPENPDRQSRKAPWQYEMEKRREEKSQKEKESGLLNKIGQLESEINNLKQTGTKSASVEATDIEKEMEELADGYEKGEMTLKDYTKKLVAISAKSLPKSELPSDITDKLNRIDRLEKEKQLEKEDLEYHSSFNGEIIPAIKKEYPHATEADLGAIEKKLKEYYFDERYISLTPQEIFTLKKSEMAKEISPLSKKTAEEGTRGVGRDSDNIDYENVTDEEYRKMSSEQREKVNTYKQSQSRL